MARSGYTVVNVSSNCAAVRAGVVCVTLESQLGLVCFAVMHIGLITCNVARSVLGPVCPCHLLTQSGPMFFGFADGHFRGCHQADAAAPCAVHQHDIQGV
jgi:hypothetical protein